VVAERAPGALVCLDTFHLITWATSALDEVRREEGNHLRRTGGAKAAKEFKGLRWLLLRNWENLTRLRRLSSSIATPHRCDVGELWIKLGLRSEM
jgi:transposase